VTPASLLAREDSAQWNQKKHTLIIRKRKFLITEEV
jgi:hypothetical protein